MCGLKVKQLLLSLLTLLFCLSSVQAEQWDYQFSFRKGKVFSLCRDYVANWERYIAQYPETTPYDLSCQLEITSKYSELFRRPQWRKVDRSQYDYWFLEAYKNDMRKVERIFEQERFDNYKKYILSFGKGKLDYVMWMADFDFDFDGEKETILRIDRGGDCLETATTVFNRRNMYNGRFGRGFYRLSSNKKRIILYGSTYLSAGNKGYFFYKGRTFLSDWDGRFERRDSADDLFFEKTGEPLHASLDISEPSRYHNLSPDNPDDDFIHSVHVCSIDIQFKKKNKEATK